MYKPTDQIIEMEVVELKVRLHCKACKKAVRKALCRIRGVRGVEVEGKSNKIRVLGYIDQKVILKAIWKMGRRPEIPFPPSSSKASSSSSSSPCLRQLLCLGSALLAVSFLPCFLPS